jgi:hypothetical protein
MTPLCFDQMARAIIAARLGKQPDAALCIELRPTYSRGGPHFLLSLRWTTVEQAERDAYLVRCVGSHDVPTYVSPRIWRYLFWHPLGIEGKRFGPFTRLAPEVTPFFAEDLRRWEALHPAIQLPATAAA